MQIAEGVRHPLDPAGVVREPPAQVGGEGVASGGQLAPGGRGRGVDRSGHPPTLATLGACVDPRTARGLNDLAEGERSEERRVGKECVSTCRSRWSPVHYKKKKSDSARNVNITRI